MSIIRRTIGFLNISNYKKFFSLLEPYVIWRSNSVIGVNPYIREYLYNDRDYNSFYYEIENAVNIIFFKKDKNPEKQIRNKLLFVGNLNTRKSLLDLLESFVLVRERIPDLTLCAIGCPPNITSTYAKSIYQYIQKNDLELSVKLLSVLPPEKVYEKMLRSSVIVVPSIQETAPMVIAEAMATGKPVVATNVGGIPDMVKDEKTGFLVDPGDIQQLAERIERILLNQDLGSKMGKNAHEVAKSRFHPNIIAEKTLTVYNEVVERWNIKNENG